MKRIWLNLVVAIILLLSLSACDSLPFDLPWLEPNQPTATQKPDDPGSITPTPEITVVATPTPEEVNRLVIWVPPEMDPELDTPAAELFEEKLQSYAVLNNNIEIEVRVKAASGAGGLLDALTATSSAAPDALPDLIALSREDLETAALKGLVYSMDGLTDLADGGDLYGYVREMALLQGSTYGLPFAGDALALVYRPESFSEFPVTWTDLLASEAVMAFPGQSNQALFQLCLYEGEGGVTQDNQRRPVLELDPLTEVFQLLQDGVTEGAFLEDFTQYQTLTQVWTAFRDGQADVAVVWTSDYLQDESDILMSITPLLPMSGGSVSIGDGMSWALASPDENRQAMAVDLAESLLDPAFLANWTAMIGYMPPRSSALEAWDDQSLRGIVSQISLMTRLRPTTDILSSLGPILQTQTQQILQVLIDPAQASQAALESLGDQ